MAGKGVLLLRVTLLVFAAAAVCILIWRGIGDEPVRALKTPALRPAPGLLESPQPAPARQGENFEELRVGSFVRPEDVPRYQILEKVPTGGDGLRSAQLLVDTRARGQRAFTLITRDLKARYAGYDVVSIEFTDSSVVLDYQGGAVIVNTPLGARRAGFIYAPPDKGYYVKAAD